MRRFSLLLLVTALCSLTVSAQENSLGNIFSGKYAIKVQPFTGSYLDQNSHFDKFRPFAPKGLNLGLELPSSQQLPWQQYLGNPTVGVGMSLFDFGHEMVGKCVSMYPYILIPVVRNNYFDLNFKVAAGLGVVTEHWYTQEDQDPDHYYDATTNSIFGCYLNAYLNAGVNLSVPITRNVALNGEFGYFHMSNGRTCMPNIGANVIYGGVGVTTTINSNVEKTPIHFADLPYGWSINITGAVGGHKSAIADPNRFFISSFHTGAVYNVTNWYSVGPGFDIFYNGAVTAFTDRGLYCKGYLELENGIVDCKSCDGEYTTSDKIRAGIALNNEFKFGLLTAIVDWGIYLRNPSRNYYYNYHEMIQDTDCDVNRPLFYKSSGASGEEAFHYIRFGLKTRVWDNFYLHASAKTHLHICEYVEFGMGYQIPFLKKSHRKPGKSIIYHHRDGLL